MTQTAAGLIHVIAGGSRVYHRRPYGGSTGSSAVVANHTDITYTCKAIPGALNSRKEWRDP